MLALNRSAIVVRPEPPFLAWLHATDPTSVTLTLAELGREPTIYLVPECGDPDEGRACLQAVFPTIFEDQLDGWWRDRTTWPTPRSLWTFTRWFDCQFHSMLLDLTDEPLTEEEVQRLPGRVDRVIGHYGLGPLAEQHRTELDEVAMQIGDDAVHFSALTYQELFARMVPILGQQHARYMAYLRDRYMSDIGAGVTPV